jgi:hypothetical protein
MYDLTDQACNTCPECGQAFDPANSTTYLHSDTVHLPKEVKLVLFGQSVVIALMAISMLAVSTYPTSDGFGPGFAFPLYLLGVGLHVLLCFYGIIQAGFRFQQYIIMKRIRYIAFLLLPVSLTIFFFIVVFIIMR